MKVKTHRRKRKSNPAKKAHKPTRRRRRHNPAGPSHHKRKTHRRRRHNPAGSFVSDVLIPVLVGTGAVGVGMFINTTAAKWIPVKYRGIVALALGTGVAFFGRKHKLAMASGATVGATGLFDLARQNIPFLTAFSAEDAGYLLGSAAADDPELAQMLGAANSDVPGVLPNLGFDTSMIPLGAANSGVPGVLPNLGFDTSMIPLGEDMEGDGLFSDDLLL